MRQRGFRRPDRHVRRLARHLPSNYIRPIEDIRPGHDVVIVCRVSFRHQGRRGNLDDQEAKLRAIAATKGARVVGVLCFIGPGHSREWFDKLSEVTELARAHGAALLAESTSRFVRPRHFHSSDFPHAKAGLLELATLKEHTHGVTLVTALHPDANWREERTFQIDRGRSQKNARGGRPQSQVPGRMKARREQLRPMAAAMKLEGMAQREIGRRLSIPESTVRRWLG